MILGYRLAQPTLDRAARRRLAQAIQQCCGIEEVRRCETFGVRAVDRRERGAGLIVATLLLPEPGETHRGPQLPALALLALGRRDGLAEAGVTLAGIQESFGKAAVGGDP
jgi:hypothetical protein